MEKKCFRIHAFLLPFVIQFQTLIFGYFSLSMERSHYHSWNVLLFYWVNFVLGSSSSSQNKSLKAKHHRLPAISFELPSQRYLTRDRGAFVREHLVNSSNFRRNRLFFRHRYEFPWFLTHGQVFTYVFLCLIFFSFFFFFHKRQRSSWENLMVSQTEGVGLTAFRYWTSTPWPIR